jgi:hypothetical protein
MSSGFRHHPRTISALWDRKSTDHHFSDLASVARGHDAVVGRRGDNLTNWKASTCVVRR